MAKNTFKQDYISEIFNMDLLPIENMSLADIGGYDPFTKEVISSFGQVWGKSKDGTTRRHTGVDIFSPKGTPVVSIADGVVVESYNSKHSKGLITIRHNDKLMSRYIHLGIRFVHPGENVNKGQEIGLIEAVNSRAPHLHFELLVRHEDRLCGKFEVVDPLFYIKKILKAKQHGRLSHEKLDQLINSISKQFDLDPYLIKSVIQCESNFRPYAVSSDNHKTKGLMQLKDSTFLEIVRKYPNQFRFMQALEIFDKKANVIAGVIYLKHLIEMFRTNCDKAKAIKFALIAYNVGYNKLNELIRDIKDNSTWDEFNNILKSRWPNKYDKITKYVRDVLFFQEEYRLRDQYIKSGEGFISNLRYHLNYYHNKIVRILYSYNRQKRGSEFVSISEIPENLIKCLVSAEDKRFFRHPGIDILSTLRAIIYTLFMGKVQGGSTITQQLVRTMLLTRKFTFRRKLDEIVLSLLIERKLSKNEIIELYLNNAYFGTNSIGIKKTCNRLFDIEPTQLDLTQCVFLVSLLKYPISENPDNRLSEKIIQRQKYVLFRLLKLGCINEYKYKIFTKTI